MKRCLAVSLVLLLTGATAFAVGPAAWFDNLQLQLTVTKDVTLTSINVYEPDLPMKGRNFYLYIDKASTGITGKAVGVGRHSGTSNWYTVTLTKPLVLKKGVYTVQTRYWATFFNAGRPTLMRFREGDLRTFQTYDRGVNYFARF